MYKPFIVILILFTISNAMILPHPGKPKTHVPRVYNVQMHAAPEVRWAPMLNDYKHALHTFMS